MSAESASEGVRLQKVLANAGVASRRVAEQLIVEGRVRVNGAVVTELGTRIDPAKDLVDVDGTAVQLDSSKRYVMLNKPTGVAPTYAASRRSIPSGSTTSGGWMPTRAACSSSPTTGSSRTCSRTPRSGSRRCTSRRSRAG